MFLSPAISEEKIDIWKNKKKQEEKSESYACTPDDYPFLKVYKTMPA